MFIVPDSLYKEEEDRFLFFTQDLKFVRYISQEKNFTNEVILNVNLLLFVLSGTKQVQIFNEHTVIPAGHGVFVPKGSYLMTEISSRTENTFESIMVLISDELLLKIFQTPALNKYVIDTVDLKNSDKVISWSQFDQPPLVNSMLNSMDAYFSNPDSVHEDFLRLKLEEILLYLVSSSNCSMDIVQLVNYIDSGHRNMPMIKFMESNFMQPWNVEVFADHYGLSLSTFKREFKQVFGESPRRWIRNRRSKQAAINLLNSNKSLTDIALGVGFSDSSQFSKTFREIYNCTPSKYRKVNN